jgi:PAS domain S-box-containing protein
MKKAPSVEELKKKIDDLEQTVAFLKEIREQLLRLVETVPEGIVILDKTGNVNFINSSLEKTLGLSRDEIVGNNYIDIRWRFRMPEGRKARDEDFIFEHIIKTGKPVADKELVLEIAGGKSIMFSINAAPYRDVQGNIVGVIAAMTDITESNRTKNEAREIKEVYERLTRYADEAIFRIQVDGNKVIYINEAAERILGYPLDDYLADLHLFEKLILPEYFASWINAVEEMEAGKNAVKNMVLGIIAKNGRTILMEFTAIAVRNDLGKITYYESLGRDITVRRFMEQELAKAQKLESIGLLAGGIAHDFNNLLTAILGSLSLAKIETKQPGSLYERLNQAEDHCLKAKTLTRRLLTYSRSGSPLRKIASIDIILQEAANFALSGKNTECKFTIADGLWSAQIDEGQINQVIHYLVINAAEAMPNGGIMEIGAQNVILGVDQVPPLQAGKYIEWYVKDHGVGIPEEHMPKLFDPYFTTKQMGSVKGMGLGLAICYSIIKSHDGLIDVQSEQGIGTKFTIYLPAINGENGEKKTNGKEEEKTITKHKIILIDDEKILLDVTSSMLTHLGYEVATAECHDDALDIYSKAKEAGQPFSLIIMDLTMRGDEGGEPAIRKWLAIHPEVKAVISSGYINDPVVEEYWKYGFAGAMVKPYTLTDLKKSLEKILAKDR